MTLPILHGYSEDLSVKACKDVRHTLDIQQVTHVEFHSISVAVAFLAYFYIELDFGVSQRRDPSTFALMRDKQPESPTPKAICKIVSIAQARVGTKAVAEWGVRKGPGVGLSVFTDRKLL